MLAALDGRAVYGVNTGLGGLSSRRLAADEQRVHQHHILLARAVGGPPWLTREQVRAVLAVRLRSFLGGDAAVSARLCTALCELLAHDVLPAVPAGSTAVAGEIVPLAHLARALTGEGECLAAGAAAATLPAGQALADAGLSPIRLAPKEGIALLEGHPVATALGILVHNDARRLLRSETLVLAADFALSSASRDVLHPRLESGDPVTGRITRRLRELAGEPQPPRALQPPVSLRTAPQILGHLDRSVRRLSAAIDRSLTSVTDSPAYLIDTNRETSEDGQEAGAGEFVEQQASTATTSRCTCTR